MYFVLIDIEKEYGLAIIPNQEIKNTIEFLENFRTFSYLLSYVNSHI